MFRLATGMMTVIVVGTTLSCVPSAQPLSDAHAAAIRDSVTATLDAFRRYAAAAQWDSMIGLYADEANFRWIENGEVRIRSVSQIRRELETLPTGMRITTSFHEPEVLPIAPGLATVITKFDTRMGDSTENGFGFGGAMSITMVHREGGWRMLAGHSSSPQPRR